MWCSLSRWMTPLLIRTELFGRRGVCTLYNRWTTVFCTVWQLILKIIMVDARCSNVVVQSWKLQDLYMYILSEQHLVQCTSKFAVLWCTNQCGTAALYLLTVVWSWFTNVFDLLLQRPLLQRPLFHFKTFLYFKTDYQWHYFYIFSINLISSLKSLSI